MNDSDFQQLIQAFVAETQDFLQSLEHLLLSLETTDVNGRGAAIKEMFRAAHSIKGAAAMLGFQELSTAAHTLEDCFAILRDGADLSEISGELITQLLTGVDCLKTLVNQALDSGNNLVDNRELQGIIDQIKAAVESRYGSFPLPPVASMNQSATPETLKIIFDQELPPLFDTLETELSQAQAENLSETLGTLNKIYYQLSGLAGMLQLPEFGALANPLQTLIDTPNITVEQLQSQGWEIAQSLRTAQEQICQGQPITTPAPPAPTLGPEPATVKAPTANASLESRKTLELKTTSATLETPSPSLQRPSIRVDLERLTELVNLVGELVINRTNLELQESQLKKEVRRIRRSIAELNQFGTQLREEYDRMATGTPESVSLSKIKDGLHPNFEDVLEMDQYTEFHSTVQEVLETTQSIHQSAGNLDTLAFNFERSTDHLRRITEQLRNRVMQLRVVNFSRAVDHLPRALREMCLTHQKDVNLLLLGRETKIDESLLDALRDPLVHLVRNAFDHGIESPAMRIAAGKPASGQIEIAAKHQGGQTIITVSDDGRGINPEKIRERVVKLEWVTPEVASDLSITELYEFLFWPGFSTTEEVSDLSGRGVGLDVVRSNLRPVRGTVKVDSRPGKGTTFIIKLPLMLSITEALMVKIDHNIIAVPLDAVEEILHIQNNQVQFAGNQPMLWWRDEFIRLVPLQNLLHYPVNPTDAPSPDPLAQDYIPVIVLTGSDGILAVAVERLVGQQEIVVKPLPSPLSKPEGIIGSTILGDGRVVTILDADDLMSQFQHHSNAVAVANKQVPLKTQNTAELPQILVVDDSYTIRQLLQLTLSRARYRVVPAKDGIDALEKLQNGLSCNLVITDIEMPRMDGFELLKNLKSTPEFSQIPVAVLTSRSGNKHRKIALELGAVQYFTKPYSEVQLLESVANLIKN